MPDGYAVTRGRPRRLAAGGRLAGPGATGRQRPGDRRGACASRRHEHEAHHMHLALIAARARELIEGQPLPAWLEDAVAAAHERLAGAHRPRGARCGSRSGPARSAEDGASASFAGQYDTYLGVTGVADVLAHIRKCWASGFSAHALEYRRRAGGTGAAGPAITGSRWACWSWWTSGRPGWCSRWTRSPGTGTGSSSRPTGGSASPSCPGRSPPITGRSTGPPATSWPSTSPAKRHLVGLRRRPGAVALRPLPPSWPSRPAWPRRRCATCAGRRGDRGRRGRRAARRRVGDRARAAVPGQRVHPAAPAGDDLAPAPARPQPNAAAAAPASRCEGVRPGLLRVAQRLQGPGSERAGRPGPLAVAERPRGPARGPAALARR